MHGHRLLLPALLLAVLGALNTGCGIIGWAISPKAERVYSTVPRTEEVEVRSIPDGALILVDGAEAGRTPKAVRVSVTEVRQQRRQSVAPGVIGLVLDFTLFGAATYGFASSNSGEGTLLSAGVGTAVLLLGTHLLFGSSVSEESIDVQPTNVELAVRYPGHEEQRRRIRVPDIRQLDFLLVPVGGFPTKAPPLPPPAPPAQDRPQEPARDVPPPEEQAPHAPPTQEPTPNVPAPEEPAPNVPAPKEPTPNVPAPGEPAPPSPPPAPHP
jgi:hypothetical protein